MRILHINSYYFAGKFYKNLYEEQVRQNLDINVYVPIAKKLESDQFNYGSYTLISRNHNQYERGFFHIKHKKIVVDIKINYDIDTFDILHAHSLFSNGYVAYVLNKEFKVPYIVAVRSTDINVFFKHMLHLRRLGIEILNNAQKIIFLSESYRNILINSYTPYELRDKILKKTVIIPNGIDAFWFDNLYKLKKINQSKIIKIMYAGCINKNKNLVTTLKAIKLLNNKNYKVHFTIVGKIKNKSIYPMIKKQAYVTYINQQPKESLIDLYRKSDVFVMPSKSETFGLVYAEAMSQGLPVIYSKGQGFDRQFEEGVVGYHVDCLNAHDIAQRILDIKDNYKNLSKNCLKLCHKFDWEIIAQTYKNIYCQLK